MADQQQFGRTATTADWLVAAGILLATAVAERALHFLGADPSPDLPFLAAIAVIGMLHGLAVGLVSSAASCTYVGWLLADRDRLLPTGDDLTRVAMMWATALTIAMVTGLLQRRAVRSAYRAAQLAERQRSSEALGQKDELLIDFIENCVIGLNWLDAAGRIQWTNRTALEMLGYRREDYVGHHFSEFHVDRAAAAELADRLARHELVDSCTVRLRCRDGEIKTVLITAQAVLFGGRFIHTRCFIRDITETTRMGDSLRDSQARLKLAVGAAELGMWHSELPLGGEMVWNEQCKAHFGLPPEAVVSMELFYSRLHPEDREPTRIAVEKAIAERSVLDLDYRTVSADGRVRWIRAIGRVSCDPGGRPDRFDGVTIDQTARKAIELELSRQAGELARSNAELEQFAYVASHDLQEPLRMITSYLQILEARHGGAFDEQARRYMDFVCSGALRMRSLINALLEYSRLGTQPVAIETIDSAVPLRDALANLDAQVAATGAKLHFASLPVVQADRLQLAQLFQNLVANALKFRSAQPPAVRITAHAARAEWVFSVTDNGIGIEEEDRERIFKIFQRLHVDGDYPGSGIGLATCRKIVERHRGRIWVESRIGEGSTFYFTLPREPGDARV